MFCVILMAFIGGLMSELQFVYAKAFSLIFLACLRLDTRSAAF